MPIRYDEFLRYCSGNVEESKYEILKNLTVESTFGPLIKQWSDFYRGFKGELAYQRNKKLERPSNNSLDKDAETSKIIALAVADKNPLNAEKMLLSIQFDKLDSLIGTHAYDDYALFGYALKLKLLERKTVFNQKNGKEELNRLVKRLEEQISGIN
ncbi:MAG: DUF2764 family protein [Clostridia bacterium]|nr:DUF2764 family protein [Clostridia bacterium]